MNRRGQLSVFSVVFIILIFVIILAIALAPFITTTSEIAISYGSLSGLEAFVIGNMLLWVIIIFIIWILWSTR